MSKYKVGDKVKIREDLVGGETYGGLTTVSDMAELKGKEVTIKRTSCSGNDEYRIKELGYTWTNEMFTQSIPNKGTIKYRITDDGITYTTLGHNSGKSIKSGKDEADNKIGILISTARALGFNEDKISGIVDALFDNDSYDSKAKCDNAIMKNDIARALSILDKYKE